MARRVALAENQSCSASGVAAGSKTAKEAVDGGPRPLPALTSSKTPPRKAPAKIPAKTPAKTPSKNSAGILEPPPDVRCIVDKTAEFVAQNGTEFEMKILSNEKRNPRFNFLKSKDAYHPYYQQRILEFLERVQSPVKKLDLSESQ